MTSYMFDPSNEPAAAAVQKFIDAAPRVGGIVRLSKVELKAYIEDVTVLNTSRKPLINAMNVSDHSH